MPNIVVFPGAQTGMTITTQALLHPGDHAIVVTPSYQSLEEGLKYAGSEFTRVVFLQTIIGNLILKKWRPPLEKILGI